ncbi:MAG: hypothetical protein ACXAEU_10900 [Candidatus Hodarchaeales archaeon]|jgi:hypothetical protein
MVAISPSKETNIKTFYIFDSTTGYTFFSRDYSKRMQIDPLITTAFLTAMYRFAQEANLSDLRVINLSELTLFFIEKNELIFAALTSNFVSPVDMISKLNLIASLFISNYEMMIINKKGIVDTEVFDEFNPIVNDILMGQSRTLDTRVKTDLGKIIEKIMVEKKEILTGVSVIGYTGEVIVDFMERDLQEVIINFINVCYNRRIYNVDFIVFRSRDHNVISRDLGEGLMLIIATNSEIKSTDVIQLMNVLYSQVKALLPIG